MNSRIRIVWKYVFICLYAVMGIAAVFGQAEDTSGEAVSLFGNTIGEDTAPPAENESEELPAKAEKEPEIPPSSSVQKEAAAPVIEVNQPTARRKTRNLSMHSGLILSGLAANNVIPVSDLFKGALEFDFNTLSQKTAKSGLHVGGMFNADWYFQFTIHETHTVKLSTTVDSSSWLNLPKNLIDFVAKSNASGLSNIAGLSLEGTVNATAYVFVDNGIMYRLKKPSYSFSARAAYFVPLAYMPNPEISYELRDAGLNSVVKLNGDARIYGHLPLATAKNEPVNVSQLLKDGGLDLSLAGSYQPADWVNITGAVDYLPLLVVTMDKGIRQHMHVDLNAKDIFKAGGLPSDPGITKTIGTLPAIKIMRPCKIRLGADFKPFKNNYLIISPFAAVPVVNVKPFYMDGGLKLESRFARDVLGVSLATNYINRIWQHELSFFVDSRFATFILAASVASHDFAKTFNSLSGVGVKLGFGIGF